MTGRGVRPVSAHPAYGVLRPVTRYASVLLAENPSPLTLEGTNTWLLRAPGEPRCLVVDPGPDDPVHLDRIAAAGPVAVILLTHGHPDHSAGARRLHELTGAPVRALDPAHRYGADGLGEGVVVAAAGVQVRVLHTPGHTGDSVCYVAGVPGEAGDPPGADAGVLTGDTVLGRGTTVVAHPDGRLGEYLDSLRRLRELGACAVLPGHGPELADLRAAADGYLRHREERLDQVRAALRDLGAAATPRRVVEWVYSDVDPVLWPAAELSVRAQLDYLRER
jgi:glyoxylase-like metal-dependent hydrolase (beta-lactamase superfamily II)